MPCPKVRVKRSWLTDNQTHQSTLRPRRLVVMEPEEAVVVIDHDNNLVNDPCRAWLV